MCCRPVAIPGLGDRDHCYIESNQDGRDTWALYRRTGSIPVPTLFGVVAVPVLIGLPQEDHDDDRMGQGEVCGPWQPETCGTRVCLDTGLETYPVEDYSVVRAGARRGSGRNSNTFARCLAEKCGLPLQPRDPGRATGWNQPCPSGW
jgi:hypothetical protein